MSDYLYKDAQEAQRKLFYSLASVSLGTLALSVQFSPGMGGELWWILLMAWLLLFISSVAAGWRLGRETTVLRNMYAAETSTSKGEEENANTLVEDQVKPIICLSNIQIWSLIFGLLANLIFAAANYLHRI